MKWKAKYFLENAAYSMGINHSVFQKARGARILVYHGICLQDHLRFNTLFIKLKAFESQLQLYKKYFNLISLDDFYQQKFNNDKFNICLTFDDGFANNYKYALPLLEQYQVPAAFFITGIRNAGYDILWNDILSVSYRCGPSKIVFKNDVFVKGMDKRYISSSTNERLVDILRSAEFEDKAELIQVLDPFRSGAESDYWLQMTEEQIKTLSGSKWATIGSHGYYHNDLAKISIDSAKQEIIQSKQYLEKITGKEIKALAFPYGSYTKEIVNETRNAGYSQLLATEFLFPDDAIDPMLRERLTINPFISNINQVYANITGNYE